jgi:hypothetical protein
MAACSQHVTLIGAVGPTISSRPSAGSRGTPAAIPDQVGGQSIGHKRLADHLGHGDWPRDASWKRKTSRGLKIARKMPVTQDRRDESD